MTDPRFLADEDFRRDIVLTVRALDPRVDFVTIREVGLSAAPDDAVLEFAFRTGRILVSHDRTTMIGAAIERSRAGLGMSGLLLVAQDAPRRPVAENVVLIANASDANEWTGVVDYLPW